MIRKKAPQLNTSGLTEAQMLAAESLLDTPMGDEDAVHDLAGVTDFTQFIKQRFLERALDAELSYHLNQEESAADSTQETMAKNKRNGTYKRKVVTADNAVLDLVAPRDRNGTFSPVIVPPHCRRMEGLDNKIIDLYARGMTTRDIQDFVREQYDYNISPALISEITDSVLEDIKKWQARPLDSGYPVIFFDAIRIKIRSSNSVVIAKAFHIAFAITAEGRRDVLGMCLADNEGAGIWTTAFNDLKNRGVNDVLIAVSDGLKGMSEALEAAWPSVMHQTCIVHLIRSSTACVNYKDRQPRATL